MAAFSIWHWLILLLIIGGPLALISLSRSKRLESNGSILRKIIHPLDARGRANRAAYWRTIFFSWLALVLTSGALVLGFGLNRGAGNNSPPSSPPALILLILFLICTIYLFGAMIAVAIRRLHDRNRVGWWILLFQVVPALLNLIAQAEKANRAAGNGVIFSLIALVFVIWGFVEIGCLPGTAGSNRYGANPLGPAENEAQVAAFD